MKVEILETIKHERDQFEAGETRVVPDNLGAYFCANGWAKDTEGKVETAERDIHRTAILDPSVANQESN